jgi:hypothetical protein
MKLILSIAIFALLKFDPCQGQSLKLTCTERQKKSHYVNDSIIITTCLLKNFKFNTTSYPDYAGRYVYSEHEVYIRTANGYTRTTNSKVFNQNQSELVEIINKRIQADFKALSSDSNTRECLADIDSIPKYAMNDLEISFNGNEIWFEVHWGLSSACRAVDGTIVSFDLEEIKKYLK